MLKSVGRIDKVVATINRLTFSGYYTGWATIYIYIRTRIQFKCLTILPYNFITLIQTIQHRDW